MNVGAAPRVAPAPAAPAPRRSIQPRSDRGDGARAPDLLAPARSWFDPKATTDTPPGLRGDGAPLPPSAGVGGAGSPPQQPASPPPPPGGVARGEVDDGSRRGFHDEPEVSSGARAIASFVVDDDVRDVPAGVLRKTDFLSELRGSVTAATEAALAGTGRSTDGCPYLEQWFGYYSTQTVERVARAVSQYAPETRGVASAQACIDAVAARVGGAIRTWARTGEVTTVPAELEHAVRAAVAGEGGAALPATTPVRRKARGASSAATPAAAARARLGRGVPLDGATRGRMQSAFGHDFGRVRIHADAPAARVADELSARAFTVGNDVAFGAGEYRPGTPAGDALLAHELAHVVQQSTTGDDASSEGALEDDADVAAIGVVASLHANGARGALADALTRLRSGVRLARCSRRKEPTPSADGCVTGNLTARTSGALQGGWSVNDYLRGGMSWGSLADPTTLGREGTRFKVQLVAPFSGAENLGVSQTMQHGDSNQAFLDGTAAYLGRPAGSVRNGDVFPEPVLDAADPFAVRPWFLCYRDGQASFADVPGAAAGDRGHIDFVTCFHSRAATCANRRCCVTWRWSVDLTPGNSANTVAQRSQSCS